MPGSKIRRGDLVTVALPGAYGKPRPALVIQADLFDDHPSLTILPLTSDVERALRIVRVAVKPTPDNGLREPSQVMIDKAHTAPRAKIGKRVGKLDDDTMVAVERALAVFLGFA